MTYAADFLLIHFHPDHGGNGCCTTVADIPRGWPRSLKRQALDAIADHANWLQSSDGNGTRAAKRSAFIETAKQPVNNAPLFPPCHADVEAERITEGRIPCKPIR